MGQAIASFDTCPTSSEDISPNEEELRQCHTAILHAQEIEKKIDDTLGTPPSRSIAILVGYRSLVDSMRPIELILDRTMTPHNPG